MEGLISLCIPCRNRTYDLRQTLPRLAHASSISLPVEIVVVDYNSQDDLAEYVEYAAEQIGETGVKLTYQQYNERNYYHMAHARNLSVVAASGEYFMILSTDIWFDLPFLPIVRKRLDAGYPWLEGKQYKGAIVCKKQVFLDAGGYDERMEYYGPEDRDLADRLRRRGLAPGPLPSEYINVIPTPNHIKVKGYREPLSKGEMHDRMVAIYNENTEKGCLVANEGKEWGQWTA